ncbi:hypothetical protein [Pararhodobacter sp. CCB-MM2]|uniref:hypothetical protein n=1 Tax=Pararhodobacter sp. CCB-MM2 TaxID=1786003 RepID=UPI000836C585|nr:hypothetical protein [Pararhodobacter sp. CCB-MM2]MCA2013820.1 hypothetical protein [Cereibacter sphaeroides]
MDITLHRAAIHCGICHAPVVRRALTEGAEELGCPLCNLWDSAETVRREAMRAHLMGSGTASAAPVWCGAPHKLPDRFVVQR